MGIQRDGQQRCRPGITRRGMVSRGIASVAGGLLAATGTGRALAAPAWQATPMAGGARDRAADIVAIAREAMAAADLRAVIVRVVIDGQEIVTTALGESITGVPATTDMHFRNGAVVFSYISTLLLRLVDRGLAALDDPIAAWLPNLPDADRVTLRMLVNMTAGYPDYVQNQTLLQAVYDDPFRQWTNADLIEIGLSTPRVFDPGTNWDYSHTNFVILGEALEKIGGRPLADLLEAEVLAPLGLRNTVSSSTAAIPEPALHAFSSERREALGIPAGTRFYEESTYWNPSWTTAEGAVQTTDIADVAASMAAIGEGTLLSEESHRAQLDRGLLGFGAPLDGCPNCHTLNEQYNYGLGIVFHGDWLLQNPLFAGFAAIGGYYPSGKIAVAAASTFGEGSFDDQGNYKPEWQNLFEGIASYLAPGSLPPAR